MYKPFILFIFLFFTFCCRSSESNDRSFQKFFDEKQIEKVFTKTLPYRILKPENIAQGEKYPLVLFLHGAGEKGTDNQKQLVNFVWRFAELKNKYPCFVLAPQCPQNDSWSYYRWPVDKKMKMSTEMTDTMVFVLDLLEKIQTKYPIDNTRIYVIGISMGGIGTWDIICRYPNKFAAAVPIAGAGDTSKAEIIKHIPIWAFHGAKDPKINVECSQNMVKALKQAGGMPTYTEYPEGWHAIWDTVAKDDNLFQWLFLQKNEKP